MKTLIISYGDSEYDGRLRELINSFSKLGEIYLFSSDKKRLFKNHRRFTGGSYLKFISEAVRFGKTLQNIDVILMDNRKAIIPSQIIRKKTGAKKMILDCRETYFFEDVKHISGKMGCLIEKPAILKSDIVIAANLERAQIMQERYKLPEMPIVFENIRGLEYSDGYDEKALLLKYQDILNTDDYIILASSGCGSDRMTNVLVENFPKVKHKCRLLIAGWSSEEDEQSIREIIQKNKSDNIEIIGRVNQDELKFLTQHCHVGIVNYCQKDINYRFCASGKIFEFLFEGIPVVTTTNPPLVRMCEEGKIGVADDLFAQGIDTVLDGLDNFRQNAMDYAKKKTVEANNQDLIDEIKRRLGKSR